MVAELAPRGQTTQGPHRAYSTPSLSPTLLVRSRKRRLQAQTAAALPQSPTIWHVSRALPAMPLTTPQSSEARLYTFSDETKQKLRKFRLGTSRAKDPQAILCTHVRSSPRALRRPAAHAARRELQPG